VTRIVYYAGENETLTRIVEQTAEIVDSPDEPDYQPPAIAWPDGTTIYLVDVRTHWFLAKQPA
jgi:hypothetical protein